VLSEGDRINSAVDQSQTTQNSTLAVGEANTTTLKNKIAQSVVFTKDALGGFRLYKAADTGSFTGTVTIALQADTAGSPSGSNLVSAVYTNAQWLLLVAGEIEFKLSSDYTPTIGTTYWMVITTSTSDTSNHPNFGVNTAGGYGSGSLKYNNTTDGWVTSGTSDLYFKTLIGTTSTTAGVDQYGLIPAEIMRYSLVDFNGTDGTLRSNNTSEASDYNRVLSDRFWTPTTGLHVKAWYVLNSNQVATYTFRLKVNGTAIATQVILAGVASFQLTNGLCELEFWVTNQGSLSSQSYIAKAMCVPLIDNVNASTGEIVVAAAQDNGTATVDTSGVTSLTFTAQMSINDTNVNLLFKGIVVEKIG